MKKLFALSSLVVIFLFMSKVSEAKNIDFQPKSFVPQKTETVVIPLGDFKEKAGDYIGKTIIIRGLVDHVCEHGGKKMFLVEEESDARVKVVPNEEMAAFKQDMVGETVEVVGVVKEFRVDEDYLTEREMKIKENKDEEKEKMHLGEGEHEHKEGDKDEDHSVEKQLKSIENLRKKLKDSGKDYLSFYSVEAIEYKIIK